MKFVLKKYSFVISVIILLATFLLARLPFFLFTPIPDPQTEDTPEYYLVVMELLSGKSKIDFSYIPIGYPLFLLVIGLINNSLLAVATAQNVLALASVIFFIYAVYKSYPSLTLWAAIVFTGYLGSENNIHWDSHLTPDSFYVSLFIFFTGLIVLFLKTQKSLYAALASVVVACVLLVRISAIFLLPLILLVALYLYFKSENGKFIKTFALIAPCAFVLLGYSAYNYYSVDDFSFIPMARMRPIKFNSDVNAKKISEEDQKFINSLMHFLPDSNEFVLVEKSWNIKKVNQAYQVIRFGNQLYLDSLNRLMLQPVFMKQQIIDSIIHPDAINDFENYKSKFAEKFGYSKVAIVPAKNTLKYRLVNFAGYFLNFTDKMDFYNHQWGWRYWFFYVGRSQTWDYPWHTIDTGIEGKTIDTKLRLFTYKEMVNYPLKTEEDFQNEKTNRNNSIVYRIYVKLKKYYLKPLFRNFVWILLFMAVFVISFYKTVKSKLNDTASYIILVVCCIHLGSAFIFSFISMAMPRYSFTTEFIYYAVVALSPLLLISKRQDIERGIN